jgi:hypothetical protein
MSSSQMSTSEPEPQSCWKCDRGKILRLPGGGEYVDCPPANWKGHSCAVKLLGTIENPFRSLPGAMQADNRRNHKAT